MYRALKQYINQWVSVVDLKSNHMGILLDVQLKHIKMHVCPKGEEPYTVFISINHIVKFSADNIELRELVLSHMS